jgi:hypothetical protein
MDDLARAPHLHSQHIQQRANSDPPFLGRDPLDRGCSIFAIADSLQLLGLASKTNPLMRWLGRFEGLEQHLEEELDPILSVRSILLQLVADHPKMPHVPKPQQEKNWHSFVMRVVAQPFVQTCGDWGRDGIASRIKWDPLQQSFMDFLALGQPGRSCLSGRPPMASQRVPSTSLESCSKRSAREEYCFKVACHGALEQGQARAVCACRPATAARRASIDGRSRPATQARRDPHRGQ